MPEGCFTRIRNHTLIGTVVVTLDNVSVLQCQHACLEAKKQSCRSLMYHPSKKRCYLNSEDMKTRDSQFFAVLDAVDYYHRTCYYKPSMPVKRESVFEDKCYEIIKGKVLIGIVDQLIQDVTSLDQCKRRCQKSKEASDIVCKSAIYYEKEKRLRPPIRTALLRSLAQPANHDSACRRSPCPYFAICVLTTRRLKHIRMQSIFTEFNPFLRLPCDRECIIASQSRSDIPDLFIEDDQAIYIENTCLSQSTSTIKKLQTMGETVPKMTTQETSPGTEPPTTVQHTELSSSITTVPQNTVGNGKPPQILRKTPISTVELSGYETPSETVSIDSAREDVITTSTTTTTTTTTEAPTTSFDAKVIDTYNVDSVVKVPSSSGYGRRLRDARVKECFTLIFILGAEMIYDAEKGMKKEKYD
ncbi:PAN domain protein [Ancylostoma duodenale]|uniref:PAN domain protein n=1 Tax=Ancylostoma duodenale TaxID=51022 RepID=A0A0C2DNE1_9BILA|nr:PAN domain protein [Ancylostoma duodenale]